MTKKIFPKGISEDVAALLVRTKNGDYTDADLLDSIELFKILDVYLTNRPSELTLHARTQVRQMEVFAERRGLRKA